MRAGRVFGFWLATPCVTTSRVRGLTYGPPRLRSTEHYRGLPDLPPDQRELADRANLLIDNAARILRLAAALGIPGGEENPRTSMLWLFPSRERLLARWADVIVDYCSCGLPVRTRTRFLMINVGEPDSSPFTCRSSRGLCSFSGKCHLHILGARNGRWLSKEFEPYPPKIAAFVGDLIRHTVDRNVVARLSSLSRASLPTMIGC